MFDSFSDLIFVIVKGIQLMLRERKARAQNFFRWRILEVQVSYNSIYSHITEPSEVEFFTANLATFHGSVAPKTWQSLRYGIMPMRLRPNVQLRISPLLTPHSILNLPSKFLYSPNEPPSLS